MKGLVATLVGWGPLGVLLLAALDSSGIPLPGGVDATLLLVSVLRPDVAWWAALAAIGGSLIGNWILFSLARKGGEAYLDRHTRSGNGLRLKNWFRRYGLVTVFVPALLVIPMPMKIPVFCTAVFGVSRAKFLAVVAAARIPRYLALAWLGQQLGPDAGGWLKAHTWHLLAFAAALFAGLFVLIRLNDRGKVTA
ncbi:MAG: VTT domain-containing protein [Bryobacteraceae bacterium]|nr:VTT domain-containing protein [Bryobacteraceae bacterium]